SVEPHPAPSPLMANALEAVRNLGFPITDDFNGAATDGFGIPDCTIRNGRRCSAADAYLDPALSRPILDDRTGGLVEKVLIENGRATGVRYRQSGGGGTIEVAADAEVILCGGAINS